MAIDLALLADLGVALAIGLLIGVQREHAGQDHGKGPLAAGSRTFPLLALLGGLAQAFDERMLPVAFAGAVLLAALGYLARVRESGDPGLATPVSAVLTFLLGALAVRGGDEQLVALVVGVVVTVILALKGPLHGFARRLAPEELRAMLAFLVVALVVLPLLPDRGLDGLLGLNPRFVWTMVVLVSAIDLAAFLFVRAFATKRGHLLAGVVGGLVSSTAVTVSMARRSRSEPERLLRIGIVAASTVMLARMLLEIAVVDLGLLRLAALPLLVVAAWCAGVLALWLRKPIPEDGHRDGGPRNPFRLTPALLFGLAFAAVLLATGWLNGRLGDAGVYGAALVSGVVDVDALTLSVARLSSTGELAPAVAARAIVLVAASNFAFKLAILLAVGKQRLALDVALALGAAPLVAVASFLLLPT